MSRDNTLTFGGESTFYVECGGIFLREDKPGSLKKGNTVRIQGVVGIFRVVDTFRDKGKLQIEVRKVAGDALFWVREIRTNNVYPVEAVASPRENDPMENPIVEYYIPEQGFFPARNFVRCEDPSRMDVSQARARNPKMLTPADLKAAVKAGEVLIPA